MNAKNLLLAVASVVLMTAGCQLDESRTGLDTQEDESVSVKVVIPESGLSVKSQETPGDGQVVNRCIMQIYYSEASDAASANDWKLYAPVDATDLYYASEITAIGSARGAEFALEDYGIRLLRGYNYKFVFWADYVTGDITTGAAADLHYNTSDFPTVTFRDYGGNDDGRDAFCGTSLVDKSLLGKGGVSVDAVLTRPLAQLNIRSTDYNKIPLESLRPNQIRVTVPAGKIMYTGLDLMTDALVQTTLTDAVTYTVPVYKTTDTDPVHLFFDYFLAVPAGENNDQSTIMDLTLSFLRDGAVVASDLELSNLPLRRNWQTNVTGSLLTDRTNVSVELAPGFGGTEDIYTETLEKAQAALDASATMVEVLEPITEDAVIRIPKVHQSADVEVTIVLPDTESNITLQYDESSAYAPAAINLEASTTGQLQLNVPDSDVSLHGNCSQVVSTAGTLIVEEGSVVSSLDVQGGDVVVYGTVTAITNKPEGSNVSFYVSNMVQLNSAGYKSANGFCDKILLKDDMSAQGAYLNMIDCTLDLNGKTLTLVSGRGDAGAMDGRTMVITNGTVVSNQGVGLVAMANSSLVLDNVHFKAEPQSRGCIVSGSQQENFNITIRNSVIESGYFGVNTNATANPVATGTIVLENTEFVAQESALMVNIPAELTATKCSFTSNWQAAFLRGGTFTFNDCQFNLTLDPSYADWPEKHVTANGLWSSGNQAETAVMLIGNRCSENSASYNYPTKVTLTNCAFSVSGTHPDGITPLSEVPAVSIWSRVEEGNGAVFNYDAASAASFNAAGKGLVVNNGGLNLTVNNQPYSE